MKKQVVGAKHPTFRFVQLAVGSPKNLPGCWGILVWCTNSVFIKCKQVLDLTLDIATDCVADEYPHEVQLIHLWELSTQATGAGVPVTEWGVPLGF